MTQFTTAAVALVVLVATAGTPMALIERPLGTSGDAGPPDELPDQVPDFVSGILDAVGAFLGGLADAVLGDVVGDRAGSGVGG